MSRISEKYSQLKTIYNNNLWQGRLILASLIIILVLLFVRLSLPYTIIYSVTYWLEQQGISSDIEDISINVTKGNFTLLGASGSKDGIKLFNIGAATINWKWRPLTTRTIHITSIELDDFDLDAKQYTDAIEVAGIVIKEGETIEQPPAEESDTVAWGASLSRINFNDLGFCFQQFAATYDQRAQGDKLIDYCGSIDKLSWQGGFDLGNTASAEHPVEHTLIVDGTFQVESLQLFNNQLESTLINIGNTSFTDLMINGINDIKLATLNIEEFTLLQRSGHTRHKHAVELKSLSLDGITVSNVDTISINSIALSRPVVSMARDESGRYRYEQWLLQQPQQADSKQQAAPKAQESAVYNIKLGNIGLIDTEICFEQAASTEAGNFPALDYCLSLGGSDWNGSIAIKTASGTQPLSLILAGDLSLSDLITTNNLLERDLLTFESLAVKEIAVNGFDDFALGSLDLENVAGLELTSAENKHSVTVASLDISNFSYRNNTAAVSRAAINDLGLEITQNKDGALDLDKWKIASTEQPVTDTTATNSTQAEPVKIKIGEFNLDSKRLLEFTDLSVTPKMQMGLSELHFNIKNLDSEKPGQKSPLKLSARTTRHGTLEINGVVMPFETKPSFDATGKVTGLDLRAASPKAEQAIGHIIKSGQMNADLRLLSEQGQLDSNITLVLSHFNLKAKSKEDAAALDKKFGMPINQSLMLLKDKKDRIKLDIPITGDINNPEFDPTDAIIKATAKATTVTLITFYTPYGLAYAGGNVLFNLATAMNFDPLVFDPGSPKLTDAHQAQLGKLAELLVERPAVHLVLCGSTNLGDRDKMFSEILDPKKTPPPPSTERLQKLKQLASDRQQNVKDNLVTAGKIAHDRLILCEPEHSDKADAIAGVEISI